MERDRRRERQSPHPSIPRSLPPHNPQPLRPASKAQGPPTPRLAPIQSSPFSLRVGCSARYCAVAQCCTMSGRLLGRSPLSCVPARLVAGSRARVDPPGQPPSSAPSIVMQAYVRQRTVQHHLSPRLYNTGAMLTLLSPLGDGCFSTVGPHGRMAWGKGLPSPSPASIWSYGEAVPCTTRRRDARNFLYLRHGSIPRERLLARNRCVCAVSQKASGRGDTVDYVVVDHQRQHHQSTADHHHHANHYRSQPACQPQFSVLSSRAQYSYIRDPNVRTRPCHFPDVAEPGSLIILSNRAIFFFFRFDTLSCLWVL
ncbi:hypothetical protein EDB80DRAFT_289163 [Ilyonectria destructans]|nr:hypothetical protein EDB80DRAFT_289163 [Ilyonectria destructans]